MNMALLKLLIFTLTFYKLIVDLDARICPPGHRVTRNRAGCDICPNKNYQDVENESQRCKACTKCDEKTGSVVKENCTKVANTKCQCRGEFVPRDNDSSTCKCDIGFGLILGECSKCEDGYFSARINSPCQKWKECKCGVNITGSRTSDVICIDIKRCSDASITTPPTSNKLVSLITRSTSHRPRGGDQTQSTHRPTAATTATTTLTASSGNTDSPDPGATYIGTAIVIFVITALLVVLTAVTCKLHIARQPTLPKHDSLCRKPVEESGDGDGSLSSLKLNPGER